MNKIFKVIAENFSLIFSEFVHNDSDSLIMNYSENEIHELTSISIK
jgi:hypothetical protein